MNVIFNGYSLYDIISKSINWLVNTDVPEIISTDNKIYHLQYIESVSCPMFIRANNGLFESLNRRFNRML